MKKMKEIIAKVQLEYKNVLSQNENILTDFNIKAIEAVSFAPSHKLEDNEWFSINNFSTKFFFSEQCRADFSSTSLNQIDNNDYNKISVIAVFQNEQKHYQRLTPSLFVGKKTTLDYSGAPKIVKHRNQIEIRKESDAVYLSNSDILYFKTIGKLKIIFPGIEVLHREATQDEVNAFIANDFITLSGITNTSIGEQNRKRIADIGTKYNNLSDEKKEKLIASARKNTKVERDGDSFVVKSETDLKKLLYAMDQRYYYADIFEENRVANSIRVVKSNQ